MLIQRIIKKKNFRIEPAQPIDSHNGFIYLVILLIINTVPAQQTDLITNIDSRQKISLDGNWQIIIDPYESGYYDYRYQPRGDGYFLNRKPATKSDLIEYNFDTAPQLQVPGDWNSQRSDLFFYEGTIWYRRSFDYPPSPHKRVFIYFGAVNYEAEIYLNGEKIGSHEGGFTPFNFEITGKLREQDNFLVVKVDNQRRAEAVPTLMTDWWNYGGITREVMLVEVPETFIQDYFIQLKKDLTAAANDITGWLKLNGSRSRQKVKIEINQAGGSYLFSSNEQGLVTIDFKAKLKLWSPENPTLYTVRICAETDTVTDYIGFRKIETKGSDILLNGQPVFLRGICIHEEAPLRGGRAWNEADAQILLNWVKELNCNFIRLAHYPHNEHIVRLADRLGIMVWEEIPVYWTISWQDTNTLALAKSQLVEVITRDRNRAAVILWSMANETPLSAARLKFLRELTNKARSLDPSRLITAALEERYSDKTTRVIDDPLGEFLDVLGCNEYIGWYEGLPELADQINWQTVYNKPLIMSEFGADALYGLHGDELTRWSEEYQESLYKHQLKMLKKISFLRGTTPWILTDFRSPRRPLTYIQDFWNRKGLISNRGEKKKAYFILQQYYQELQRTKK
jgi:beta-glucuronidase